MKSNVRILRDLRSECRIIEPFSQAGSVGKTMFPAFWVHQAQEIILLGFGSSKVALTYKAGKQEDKWADVLCGFL